MSGEALGFGLDYLEPVQEKLQLLYACLEIYFQISDVVGEVEQRQGSHDTSYHTKETDMKDCRNPAV